MSSSLNAAIIGLGWAGEAHLKGYQETPAVNVVALADTRPDRLAELQLRYQVPDVYTDYEELLARDDIDLISVATPNHLHAPATIAALESGRHVLCEKPLAHTYAEAARMVEAAQKAGRVLKVMFNRRQRGDMQVLKRHIEEGGLGRIYHAKAYWLRRDGIPGMGGWFTTKALSGGGPLIDLGVHVLDMALYLMGEPGVVAVSGATYAEFGPRGRGAMGKRTVGANAYDVEDLALAFIRLADGATLQLEASWATYREPGDLFGVRLYGTEGGAVIDVLNYTEEDTLRIFSDTGGVPSVIQPILGRGGGKTGAVQAFVEIVRGGDWAAHDGCEGLVRSQILEACYQSARLGREVRLDELDAD